MFELYLDSADIQGIGRLAEVMPLTGITTNPSILANQKIGVNRLLSELSSILGQQARFHVQVVSATVDDMVAEARQLHALPFDVVAKIPVTPAGLAAIKLIKHEGIPVLATAIHSVQQGFMAALCGADYLAPYVNRIDTLGCDGVGVVADLQLLLEQHCLNSKILAASFKSAQQVIEVSKLGIAAATLSLEVASQMLTHPAADTAIAVFERDWRQVFRDTLSFQS